MKALRWILFCLLAFGLGTGAAFALHPPTLGIPTATASKLSDELAAVQRYAAEGRCGAVRGNLASAASTISKLPADTSQALIDELSASLSTVSATATTACQRVADAAFAKQQAADAAAQAKADAAEPSPTATPDATPPPAATTPDGGPDPGTDEGGGVTGDGSATPNAPVPTSPGGGAAITGGDAVRQALERQVEKIRQRFHDLADAAQGDGQ